MVDGHVVWRYNLGDLSAEIVSAKTYDDNKWHQVIASRQRKEGVLTVKTHDGRDDVVTGTAPGDFIQLDLVAKATKIFAGGVPEDFSLVDDVLNRRFVGGLDDFSYSEDHRRLGLWNFVAGESNTKGKKEQCTTVIPSHIVSYWVILGHNVPYRALPGIQGHGMSYGTMLYLVITMPYRVILGHTMS